MFALLLRFICIRFDRGLVGTMERNRAGDNIHSSDIELSPGRCDESVCEVKYGRAHSTLMEYESVKHAVVRADTLSRRVREIGQRRENRKWNANGIYKRICLQCNAFNVYTENVFNVNVRHKIAT